MLTYPQKITFGEMRGKLRRPRCAESASTITDVPDSDEGVRRV